MRPFVTKKTITKQAVNRLKNLGFTNVSVDNIMQDDVYRQYFVKMLRENLNNELVSDLIIKELLKEIENPYPAKTEEKWRYTDNEEGQRKIAR